MTSRITFIGTFRIPADGEEVWREASFAMAAFVAAKVPRILSFNFYVDSSATEGTVVYEHPDADSLAQHLASAAQEIEAGSAMVEVLRIDLLGQPHQATIDGLRAGGAPVSVKPHFHGFVRGD